MGENPVRESILILLAQSALETGYWKGCHCWNLGNVKSHDGDGRDYTYYRCSEVKDGEMVWFSPPSPECRFRAYRSLYEGAADHLAFMSGMRRYSKAWAALLAGQPRAFVRELKSGGYFTSAVEPYENAVAGIFAKYQGSLRFAVSEIPVIDDETRDRTMALVAERLREEGAELVDAEEHDQGDTTDDGTPNA
jgi:flagellum-specific peptidoglycan hydrolase FlgJ